VLATDERRAAVHAWLRRIAVLGATSLPATSAALAELLEEPTDDVWREAVDGLVARLDSIWN
jgi:HEAT repeat protein